MKTAGDILRAARKEKGWTIAELSARTKVQERFLEALENAQWNKLPEAPFVKGFIRTTAQELGLKPDGVIAIFRRDFGINKKGKIVPRAIEEAVKREFHWNPKLTIGAAIGFVVIVFLAYMGFQLQLIVAAPQLEITSPQDNAVVGTDIPVEGQTDPSATVSINGQEIKKNRNGSFSQIITLTEGTHRITITAISQTKKTTTVEKTVRVSVQEKKEP